MTRARDLARIANSNALTVDSSGNVGIGFTVPTSKLSVVGIVSATSFSGNVTGTATSTTNIPNLTGDISSSNTVSTLATVNSNVGTFGNGTSIPTITVNAKGLITGVTTTAVNPANDGTLTLAVSGTGLSGSASFTANQSGASSFTVTSNATNANTVSTIVARDASGNFSAGIITANLTGTATTANALNTSNSYQVAALGIGQSAGTGTELDLAGRYAQTSIAVAALDIDCSLGNYFTKTVNGSVTFTVSNIPASRTYTFALHVTHTSGTITWFSGVKWPKNTAPTLTTSRQHTFIFTTHDGGTNWFGAALVDYTT